MRSGTDFERYLKPYLARRLDATAMAVAFDRAEGDYLFLADESGGSADDGRVLDLVGGFGATLLGHNHPEVVAAARRVLDEGRPFLCQGSVRAEAGRLARRLSERVRRATASRYLVTLANSGAEAVEAALKHAELDRRARLEARIQALRRSFAEIELRVAQGSLILSGGFAEEVHDAFGIELPAPLSVILTRLERAIEETIEEPPVALAVEGSFHGKTVGASQLTHNPHFRSRWRTLGPGVVFLRPDVREDLDRAVEEATVPLLDVELSADGTPGLVPSPFVNMVACFAEPIQGEGGVRPLSDAYLRALREASHAGGFPLVLDEIQSGMGRTGTFLASEPSGISADYYTLAKSLGGGLGKVAALLVEEDRYVEEFGYVHSSTYADDHHASAVANAALDVIEEDDGAVLERSREKGDYLKARLHELQSAYPDQILAVRGRGLLVGVELAPQDASKSALLRVLSEQDRLGQFVCGHLLAEKRIRVLPTLSAGATLRIQPSTFIETGELDRFCQALEEVLSALRDSDAHRLARYVVGKTGASDGSAPENPERPPPAVRPSPAARSSPDDPADLGERAPPDARIRANGLVDGRVGFLAHFPEPGDLRLWDPTLEPFSEEDCTRFLDRTRGALDPFVTDESSIASVTGTRVRATTIALPFTAEQAVRAMRSGDDAQILSWVDAGVELARELGCTALGFGGYTSIVTKGCRTVYAPGMAVTTGNALTAAAALAATMREADRLGIGKRRLGVVGAAGNIGRALAEAAAPEVDELLLVGRPHAARRLERMAEVLRPRTVTEVATELAALRTCTLIISASNAPRPIVFAEHVSGHGPVVVSDVALPGDVSPEVGERRPAVVHLRGGLIRAPMGQSIELGGAGLQPGTLMGCFAETLLLGFEGIRESFCRGPVRSDLVRRARELADRHGFSIDEPVFP